MEHLKKFKIKVSILTNKKESNNSFEQGEDETLDTFIDRIKDYCKQELNF